MSQTNVFPANVSSSQVIALIEATIGEGGRADIAKLANNFGFDIKSMLPILSAAEILDLIKIDGGDVAVTDLGFKLVKNKTDGLRLLKVNISKIEPFKTAIELSKNSNFITSKDVSEALANKGVSFSEDQMENEKMIDEILIHWAIYTKVLKYNGKTALFSHQ
ncbi:MAG: AAA-associated domain-containing protein [Thermoprotei archaeon]